MSPRRMPPAFPPRYYQERWRGMGCLVWPALLFGGFAAGFVFALLRGGGGPWQIAGLALSLLLLGTVLYGALQSVRVVRIFPYYNERLAGADTYLSGHALARNCLRLDAIAQERGVRTISEFGFNDPLRGESREWHDPVEGLKTIVALLEAVKAQPERVDDADTVGRELERIRQAFEMARSKGVRFAFLLELGDATNSRIWEIRQGHI